MRPSSMVSGGSGCVSGSHSRSTGVGLGGDVQRTPSGKVRQRSKSQMRRLEDGRSEEQGGGAGSGSTAHRPLAETDWSVGFVFDSEDTNSQLVLLPPKPPSPLRTIAQVAVEPTTTTIVAPKGKIKELTSSGRKSHPHFFLASALSAFDMHTQSPRTLLPAFSAVPSSPLSVSALAPPRTPVYAFVDIVPFFVFNTDWVTFSAGITEQARSGGCWSFAREPEHVCHWEGRQRLV